MNNASKEKHRTARTLGLVVATAVATASTVGCGPGMQVEDVTQPADSSSDTAMQTDTGQQSDTGMTTDSGVPTDSGMTADSGMHTDVAMQTDRGVPVPADVILPDTGGPRDAATDGEDVYPDGIRG